MPNPANIDSQAAKEAGLTYWEYVEKTYHCDSHYVWGVKKVSRKQARKENR